MRRIEPERAGAPSVALPREASETRPASAPLRVANTPVRVLQHAYGALVQRASDAAPILARLRRHFREQGQLAAQEGSPLPRLFARVRQTLQTAQTATDPDPAVVAHGEIILQAVEAAVHGYLQEQARRDGLDSRVRDDALVLLEAERQRLARELHDETGQILTATLFKIDTCLNDLPADRASLAAQLRDIRQTLLSATRDLHRLVYSLRPPMLGELGLVPTLQWLARQFETQYQVPTRVAAPAQVRLPDPVELALFRIVQEALTNVARHAQARRVQITLEVGAGQVSCTVQDDGRGFEPERVLGVETPRLGLLGMRERARLLGGSLTITAAPGAGTTIRATFPYGGAKGGEHSGLLG